VISSTTVFSINCSTRFPEDGGSMTLRNVGILPQHHTASQHGRPRLERSSQRKPQISQDFTAITTKASSTHHSKNVSRSYKYGIKYALFNNCITLLQSLSENITLFYNHTVQYSPFNSCKVSYNRDMQSSAIKTLFPLLPGSVLYFIIMNTKIFIQIK
jgi:hypothetical protein